MGKEEANQKRKYALARPEALREQRVYMCVCVVESTAPPQLLALLIATLFNALTCALTHTQKRVLLRQSQLSLNNRRLLSKKLCPKEATVGGR